MSVETYYTVIGVPETATPEEIKTAYREVVRQVHPDSVPNASAYWKREAEEKTKEVNEAYGVLSSPSKRREYDMLLAEARGNQTSEPTTGNAPAPPQASAQSQGPYCGQCGSTLYASGYCPSCQKFATASSTPPAHPHTGTRKSPTITTFTIYAYVVGGAIAIAALSVTWVAVSCSVVLCALLYWRKVPARYKRRSVVALLVSLGFGVGDIVYSGEVATSAEPVYDGKYSEFPCGKGQVISPIDHRPCKPQPPPAGLNSTVLGTTAYGVAERPKKQSPVRTKPSNLDRQRTPTFDSSNREGVKGSEAKGKSPSNATPDVAPSPPPFPPSASGLAETRMSPQSELSSLTSSEHQSIESACSNAKYLDGPAAYNRCLSQKLAAWARGPKQPDLSALTSSEHQSIESACSNAKYLDGPAAYNQCLTQKLQAWERGPKQPDLSVLTPSERQSIESACSSAKYLDGPAAYDKCLVRQLDELRNYR